MYAEQVVVICHTAQSAAHATQGPSHYITNHSPPCLCNTSRTPSVSQYPCNTSTHHQFLNIPATQALTIGSSVSLQHKPLTISSSLSLQHKPLTIGCIQIFNRDFETLGRGRMPPHSQPGDTTLSPPPNNTQTFTGLDRGEPSADPSSFLPWYATSGASAATDNTTQPFATNPTTLRLAVTQAGGGLSNPGYWGINAPVGSNFTVSFYAKSEGIQSLSARLVSKAGAVLGQVGVIVESPNIQRCL